MIKTIRSTLTAFKIFRSFTSTEQDKAITILKILYESFPEQRARAAQLTH